MMHTFTAMRAAPATRMMKILSMKKAFVEVRKLIIRPSATTIKMSDVLIKVAFHENLFVIHKGTQPQKRFIYPGKWAKIAEATKK